jgi:hypothetical protein
MVRQAGKRHQAGQTPFWRGCNRFPTEDIVLQDDKHDFIHRIMEENGMQTRHFNIVDAAWLLEKDKPLGMHASLGVWFETDEAAE